MSDRKGDHCKNYTQVSDGDGKICAFFHYIPTQLGEYNKIKKYFLVVLYSVLLQVASINTTTLRCKNIFQ
jgi:hypothetical protein